MQGVSSVGARFLMLCKIYGRKTCEKSFFNYYFGCNAYLLCVQFYLM